MQDNNKLNSINSPEAPDADGGENYHHLLRLFDKSTEALIQAFLSLDNKEECLRFLTVFCSVKEIKDMSMRLEVAGLLHKGMFYSDIASKTGASTATISRVSRALNYGEGGYISVIKKLEEVNNADS